MFRRYLRAQFWVLVCGGIVGPIFLIVYFALGPMARPELNWMFWAGLLVTAADVLAALALANHAATTAARSEHLARHGVLARATVTGISDTPVTVNGQQLIEVDLRIQPPGQQAFSDQQTIAASATRMQTLTGHRLVVLVEPGTHTYEIDWEASAVVAGVVPAEFTIEEDGATYDLSGNAQPLLEILQLLHENRIPLEDAVDIRSNPAVREQVARIVRAAAAVGGQAAATGPSVTGRLAELEALRAAGTVTEAEYAEKRREILAQL